jgi:hypothetical protein
MSRSWHIAKHRWHIRLSYSLITIHDHVQSYVEAAGISLARDLSALSKRIRFIHRGETMADKDDDKRERTRTRAPRAMGQLSASSEDGGPTIVGGQPPRRRGRSVNVPVGIERVLYLAAEDEVFRKQLLADREAAVRAKGFRLRDSELAMLRTISETQLLASIDALDVTPQNLERRTFMRAVAVSAVTVAAGKALSGCGDDDKPQGPDASADSTPGTDSVAHETAPGFDAGGIRPEDGATDTVIHDIDVDQGMAPAGILPDSVPIDSSAGSFGIRPKDGS